MKVHEWLGLEAKPKRGIIKRKPQRGKKHQVSEKERNRLGEMFNRLNNAPHMAYEDSDKGKHKMQCESLERSDLMFRVERSHGENNAKEGRETGLGT